MILYLNYYQFNQIKCGHISFAAYDPTSNKHVLLDFYPGNPVPVKLGQGDPTKDYLEGSYTVTLETTKITLEALKTTLSRSKYSSCKNYKNTDNCVNAVLFALEKCGILLPIHKAYKFKHLCSGFFMPTKITTPRELFSAAMKYKYDTNENKEIKVALEQLSEYKNPELVALKDFLAKNQHQLNDIEKAAAIYILECFKCSLKSSKELDNRTQVREMQAAAMSFRGSPSYARFEVGLHIAMLGGVLALMYLMFTILPSPSSNSKTEADATHVNDYLTILGTTALLTITAGALLTKSGTGFGLYKNISAHLPKPPEATPQITAKSENDSSMHLKMS